MQGNPVQDLWKSLVLISLPLLVSAFAHVKPVEQQKLSGLSKRHFLKAFRRGRYCEWTRKRFVGGSFFPQEVTVLRKEKLRLQLGGAPLGGNAFPRPATLVRCYEFDFITWP